MDIDFKKIENIFRQRTLSSSGGLMPAAVLAPLYEENGEIKVLITQRALDLDHQPGDFCFPGGRAENNESPEETAVRETFEETGIQEKDIDIMGRLDFIVSPFGIYIIPIAAKINLSAVKNMTLSHDEVEKAVSVPLSFFMETVPEKYTINMKHEFPSDFPFDKIFGGKNYQWSKPKMIEYFYEYNGDVIWGLTARMIKNLCEIIKIKDLGALPQTPQSFKKD